MLSFAAADSLRLRRERFPLLPLIWELPGTLCAVGSKAETGNPNAVPSFNGISSRRGSACFLQEGPTAFWALKAPGQSSTHWWTRHKEILKILSPYIQIKQSQEALFIRGQRIFVP